MAKAKPKARKNLYHKLRPYTFNKPILAAFAVLAVVTGVLYVATPEASCGTIHYGASGSCVKTLQTFLRRTDSLLYPYSWGTNPQHYSAGYPYYCSYSNSAVDGQWGPETQKAVLSYQKHHKDIYGRQLAADGYVGPLTWGSFRKIYRYYNIQACWWHATGS